MIMQGCRHTGRRSLRHFVETGGWKVEKVVKLVLRHRVHRLHHLYRLSSARLGKMSVIWGGARHGALNHTQCHREPAKLTPQRSAREATGTPLIPASSPAPEIRPWGNLGHLGDATG